MYLVRRLLSLFLLAAFLFPEALHATGDGCARRAAAASMVVTSLSAADQGVNRPGPCDHPGRDPASGGMQPCAAPGACTAGSGLLEFTPTLDSLRGDVVLHITSVAALLSRSQGPSTPPPR